ncbi:MAG: NAD(P)-dependent glycerol-3-phosphate dehydrogenase [Lachnospiraceae bacterium]|nr:NAD(P)-dependent glycerol-3-phosphate dehydrogenase [Lachnospiraceae bacterium]
MADIGVLGAGTWGMALTRMLSLTGHDVTVWSALPQEIEEFSRTRRQPNLPGMIIPDEVIFTSDIRQACESKDLLLFVVPSVFVRSTAAEAAPFIPEGQLIADAAKGIESGTLMTLTQVISDELEKAGKTARLVALSGPTHAEEVAKDLPTTIVAASHDEDAALMVQRIFMNDVMRVYTNDDITGVELCGAMKNIIALASGAALGLGYGDNTKAALITRGMHEITCLGIAMGCDSRTFSGLAGIGDLIVTATSNHSRNNRCGHLIGQGLSPEDAIREVGMVVEGINAIPAALELKDKYGIDMPLVDAIDAVVNHGADPKQTVHHLMTRAPRSELEYRRS